ncbi:MULTISPECIES: CYTH domain-containing protein [unclassified Microbacterium]|uniref:CYTH domain-containing protein n=1 Tax=unclassified Microbacterium TaxID=2609290 RepID=UPI00214B17F9|nr:MULTISPECIES: CYTH domain-containing protein [unclassified Microbacterium]MCR2785908.1 CYTH domain-containing protein [Microbacterium sp. zg.B96]MDL5349975.1 CYTH domain-containing protein [Microbacterium sp. zg-YB36]WIM17117.1 CYTH domain-containing protein [Microbacterium sp. zg-B96]
MASTPESGSADEPTRSLEVERTYDVDESTPLPDWTSLPGVATIGDAERRDLDARYLDTAERQLALGGVAVRRRTGGPDAGWHIKISSPEGKHEWAWPLDAEPDADAIDVTVPAAVVDALAAWAHPPFTALARIRNARVAYALRDAAGAVVAEFVDDRVTARDERAGTEASWREWELELGPAAPTDPTERAALFAAADALVAAMGGRPAASASKLARALGA